MFYFRTSYTVLFSYVIESIFKRCRELLFVLTGKVDSKHIDTKHTQFGYSMNYLNFPQYVFELECSELIQYSELDAVIR